MTEFEAQLTGLPSSAALRPAVTYKPSVIARSGDHSSRLEWFALCAIWAALIPALIWQAYHVGITADEPSHLVSASLYWKGQDRLLPRDMPPLIKIASGITPATRNLAIPYDKPAWKQSSEWGVGLELMLNLPKPSIQPIFFQARLPMIVFPVLTTLILFLWGRALFGPLAGVAAAFLFAFEPTSMGHGALVKNDHAAAFGYLFFWYRAWRYWQTPGWVELALFTLAAAVAIMAKLSMLVVLVIAPPLIVARWLLRDRQQWGSALLHSLVLLLAVYGMMLASSWFDIRPLHQMDLDRLRESINLPAWLSIAAWPLQFLPVPFLYWDGVISLLNSHADGSPVYLAGRIYEHGTPWYFPIAFALKAPHALQLLLALGVPAVAIAVWSRALKMHSALFLIAAPLIYIGCASLVSMQLGFRLILPALPFGVLLCTAAFAYSRKWWHAALLLLLAASIGVTTARHFDRLIGYYNGWAGSPEWATYFLADSNADWGQDLPALNRWYRETKPGKIRIFYFGMDNSDRFFSEEEVERMPTPWNLELIHSKRFQPEPGYYAVSVNQLRGSFFPDGYRDYLMCFRAMKPVHYAGASIFIYKIL